MTVPAGCYSPFYQRVGEQLGLVVPFTEGESCGSCLSSSDYSCNHVGAIRLGADSASWLPSVAGVALSGAGQDDRLTSSFSLDSVMAAPNGTVDGSSVELWLLSTSLADDNVVMNVGAVPTAASYNANYTQIAPGDSLLVVQAGSSYQFVVQLDPLGNSAALVLAGDIPTVAKPYPYDSAAHAFHPLQSSTPTLTQLVLVLNATGNTTSLYVNGQLAQQLTKPFLSPITSWFTPSSFISFAQTSSSPASPTWAGQVRLIAFYTSALSLTQVQTNWNAALPPTVPQPPPVTAVSWSRAQPSFTVNFTSAGTTVWVTLVALPTAGSLSWTNGSVQVSISALPLLLDGTAPIVFTYTPPLGVNASFVANISYTLSSPSAPSLASNPGVITFDVSPAISPPVAFNLSINATAQVQLLVQLAGQDEDTTTRTSPVTSTFIATLPMYGTLYQCTSNTSVGDGLKFTSASTYGAVGSLIPVTDTAFRLWYVPSPASLTYSELAVVAPLDLFTFLVEVKGSLSSPAPVKLTVLNNLHAAAVSLVLTTDNATQVQLAGSDAANQLVDFTILSLPLHGALLDGHNISVVPLAPLALPLWYLTAQDRWGGVHDRSLAPSPDSFTYAATSPSSGFLSPPATVLVAFAPTLGPPLLVLRPPRDASLLTVGVPANFSVFVNSSGLAVANSTTWTCTLTLTPTSGVLNYPSSSPPLASLSLTYATPQSVTFDALTADANMFLSNLSFTGSQVGAYTVTVVVANAGEASISSTASMALQVTMGGGQGDGVGGDSAASVLPFNALYLWVAVGVVVALVIAALLLRRYGKKRGPVLTHEERHILTKAGGGKGRLDAGVTRAKGLGPSSSSSAGGGVGLGAGMELSPTSAMMKAGGEGQRQRQGKGSGSGGRGGEEDVLGSMTAVCLANVNLAEKSHLGSRMDSDAWGQFGEAQQQKIRGVQLLPTTAIPGPFDPYATGNIDRYEGVEGGGSGADFGQTLSSTIGVSQLMVVPADGAAEEKSITPTRPSRLLMQTDSFDRTVSVYPGPAVDANPSLPLLLSPAHSQALRPRPKTPLAAVLEKRTRLAPLSVAGLLASPRLAATPSSAALVPGLSLTPLRDQIVPTRVAQGGRGRLQVEGEGEGEGGMELPQSLTSPRAHSPAHSDRTVLRRPPSLQLPTPHPHSRHHSLSSSSGELVPVNPMVPVNLDSPRYPLDVYNRGTGERERVMTPSSGRTPTPRGVGGVEGGSVGEVGEELERMAAEVMRDHPLFRTTSIVTREEEGDEDEEAEEEQQAA